MASSRATIVGLVAILLWSTLALLTASTGATPPFLLTALTFAIAGSAGLAVAANRPAGLAALRQPPLVWLHGVGGLFGFHFFYFTALKLAPPAEASLVAYLWPLLIVLFSAMLPGGRLAGRHILGAALGLAGTALLVGGRSGGFGFETEHLAGYASAAACAVAWAAYSVTGRLFSKVPTEAVAGFCLATAALAAACHLALEPTVWPAGVGEWLAVLGLGLGPVGLAFFAWDVGMKHGDVATLGVAAYAAPLVSTLLLVAFGYAQASLLLAGGCALIVGGALVATLFGRRRPRTAEPASPGA
ncbi:aromatic amino acid exporter YddG [Hansschlegelia zhihuaiae]|uniref:DMT family transporter n=1 Tax=Hansschlegelia zhihuaiae TaxID=405005 RepID=A0A4Q0MJN0_9HYPH|nr:DMT family transporter [Hansschlegelia zhihuaiae]RXF73774.1 DMT family transporter [Hansschlegelia zhihuaiae]